MRNFDCMRKLPHAILFYCVLSLFGIKNQVSFVESKSFSLGQSLSIKECREWGFDPSNLSCDTCSLLLQHEQLGSEQFQIECQKCCQKYRKNPSMQQQEFSSNEKANKRRTMYKSALLVYGDYGIQNNEEVQGFLTHDLEALLDRKGEDVLSVAETDPRQPPLLLLFNDPNPDLYKSPDETIKLNKWKREDMKELISNVLPDLIA